MGADQAGNQRTRMDDEIDGICELVLESRAPAVMVEFYERLGLEIISGEPGRVWLSAGPAGRIGIWTPGEKEHRDRGGTHVHFALSVGRGRLDSLGENLKAIDPSLEGPLDHEGGDRSMYLSDPEGNRVELWDYFNEGDGARSGVDGPGEEPR